MATVCAPKRENLLLLWFILDAMEFAVRAAKQFLRCLIEISLIFFESLGHGTFRLQIAHNI